MQLRDYQRTAVRWLRDNPRAGLFLDMGLGKTASVLSALTPRHLPALVVAPKRVAENVWEPEARRWARHLSVSVAAGTPRVRATALGRYSDVTVLGRDNLADALPHLDVYRTVILDESSGFKTRNTKRWKDARRLIEKGMLLDHVWALTGTPSPNGLMDLWAQLYLVDGGTRLGRTLGEFRRKYFTPGRMINGVVVRYDLRPGAEAMIHQKLEDICLSMTAKDVGLELPPMTINRVRVPMASHVRRVYEDMKGSLVASLPEEIHTAANAAVLSSKLSQISAGAMLVDDADLRGGEYSVLHMEKTNALREIVDGTGSPVLVFYRFRFELDLARKVLGDRVFTADEPNLQERWNAGEFPVLMAHPASIGHGLNLQHGGHTIVWTSLTWSLEEWQQANKRLARSGQTNPVIVHVLETPKTVDAAVLQALEGKATTQDALLAHLKARR